MPGQRRGDVRPWLYVAPVLILLTAFLVYPSLATFRLSFLGPRSVNWVGFENYRFTFTSSTMLLAYRNNLLWLIFFTSVTLAMGLVFAVLTDKVKYESAAKSLVFLPQAISFVGAGVIWRFVYDFQPRVGVVNAILTAIFPNMRPIGWLVNSDLATYALIVVGIWMWTGYAMVIFSAAIKDIPEEVEEAAVVDGANPFQMFWRITIPMIASTIAVVATTLIITVLKVFDLIYVMTGGQYRTNVIANQMYYELYITRNNGRASAIAVVLLLMIVPVMLVNIRRFQEQEALR
jgi:alpha-glucoside transport system permease protein